MTLCPWGRTPRKVTLRPGLLSAPYSPLFIAGIIALPLFPRKPYLISLSVINLLSHRLNSTLLIFSFIYLPCFSPPSIAPSRFLTGCSRLSELVTRTQSAHLKRGSIISTSRHTGPLLTIYSAFVYKSVVSATCSSHTSCCTVTGHLNLVPFPFEV